MKEASKTSRIREVTKGFVSTTATPHQVLQVSPNATTDQLRRAYKARLLEVHPDKPNGSRDALAVLNHAYEQLTSSMPQAVTASAWVHPHPPAVVSDTVNVDDMDVDDDAGVASYDCRCGDLFACPLDHLLCAREPLVVVCQGCSLAIRVVV